MSFYIWLTKSWHIVTMPSLLLDLKWEVHWRRGLVDFSIVWPAKLAFRLNWPLLKCHIVYIAFVNPSVLIFLFEGHKFILSNDKNKLNQATRNIEPEVRISLFYTLVIVIAFVLKFLHPTFRIFKAVKQTDLSENILNFVTVSTNASSNDLNFNNFKTVLC